MRTAFTSRMLFLLVITFHLNQLAQAASSTVVENVKSSTVFVINQNGSKSSTGSGFLINRDSGKGIIVTNAHVVQRANDNKIYSVIFNSGSSDANTLETALVAYPSL